MVRDFGDWKYEESLEGYGPATQHVWVNENLDGVVKIALSEGGHIMKCERGEWLITLNLGGGPPDRTYCCETEDEALRDVQDLVPSR